MIQDYKGFIVLFIIAVSSMWLLKKVPDTVGVKSGAVAKHDVDYFSVNYTKLQMNELGLPDNKVAAEYAVHYRDMSEIELIKPVNTSYKLSVPTWVTRSESGVILDSGDKLFLNGKVTIDKVVNDPIDRLKINTTNLVLEPSRHYAETAEWAELLTETDTISGVGMQLYYQAPMRLDLLAKVRGRHDYK